MKFLKSNSPKQLLMKTMAFSMLIGFSIALIKTIMTAYTLSNPDILLTYNRLMKITDYIAIVPFVILGIQIFKQNKNIVTQYANKKFIITSVLISFAIFIALMISLLGGPYLGLSLIPASIITSDTVFSIFLMFLAGGLFYYIPHGLTSFAFMFLSITNPNIE